MKSNQTLTALLTLEQIEELNSLFFQLTQSIFNLFPDKHDELNIVLNGEVTYTKDDKIINGKYEFNLVNTNQGNDVSKNLFEIFSLVMNSKFPINIPPL